MLAATIVKLKRFNTDFVLVSNVPDAHSNYDDEYSVKRHQREVYLQNLRKEGLKVETKKLESSDFSFDLIHVPKRVLERYGEILKMKMPLKASYCDTIKLSEKDIEDQDIKEVLKKETKLTFLTILVKIFGESSALVTKYKSIFIPNLSSLKENHHCSFSKLIVYPFQSLIIYPRKMSLGFISRMFIIQPIQEKDEICLTPTMIPFSMNQSGLESYTLY